jgi:CPA2 family monovalent cation:H+ antiporter-2
LKDLFDKQSKAGREQEVHEDEIAVKNFTVTRDSRLFHHTIRSSGIRDEAQALVVGLERNGERMLNPESTIHLQEGDIVWIVGVKERIHDFFQRKP